MASVVLPPSADHFNSLPSITKSDSAAKDLCSPDVLAKLCSVFLSHHVQHIFGLSLAHQYFEILQNKRLVNAGNVAVPINDGPNNPAMADTRWVFSGDKVIPISLW